MYYNGEGVGKDYVQALIWFGRSADQGNARAQKNLGTTYQAGMSISKGPAEVIAWLRNAADQGYPPAENELGAAYHHGDYGVSQDHAQAVVWYRKAAEHGDAAAQSNLGAMYANGQGVAQNFLLAHMWADLAESKLAGDVGEQATKIRDSVARFLTQAEVALVQEMAKQCEAKSFKNCE